MNYSVKKAWHSWSVDGEEGAYVGGYAIQYANNFTFATVRGAGHMVPETRAVSFQLRKLAPSPPPHTHLPPA